MKRISIVLAVVALLSGCATVESIKRPQADGGQGGMQVVDDSAPPVPAGYGDLRITLGVKTRNTGSVVLDTGDYGTARYQLLVGVNGRTVAVNGAMQAETGDYRGSNDPEAGNGVRYRFAATVRLPVGSHRITVALPGDKVTLEREVTVRQGVNRLDLKPVYGERNPHRRIGFTGSRTYYEGVEALETVN